MANLQFFGNFFGRRGDLDLTEHEKRFLDELRVIIDQNEGVPYSGLAMIVAARAGFFGEARISDLKADNLSLVNDLEAEGVRIEALARENRELKSRLQATLDSLALANETTRLHAREAERLRKAISGYEETIASNLKEEDRLRADLTALDQDYGNLLADYNTMSDRLAKLDALLASEHPPLELLDRTCYGAGQSEIGAAKVETVNKAWRWFRETLGAGGSPRPGAVQAAAYKVPEKTSVEVAREVGEELRKPGGWFVGTWKSRDEIEKIWPIVDEPVAKDSDFIRPKLDFSGLDRMADTLNTIAATGWADRHRGMPTEYTREWMRGSSDERIAVVLFLNEAVEACRKVGDLSYANYVRQLSKTIAFGEHISPPSEQTSASPESERRSSPPPATPESEP